VDVLQKEDGKRLKEELARAKEIAEHLARLHTPFGTIVGKKTGRVHTAIEGPHAYSIKCVKEALAPWLDLPELLLSLATVLSHQRKQEGIMLNVRIGVYLCRDGVMCPIYGMDLNNLGSNPFKSYATHQHAFRMTQPAGKEADAALV